MNKSKISVQSKADIEKCKIVEFVGDALLSFIVREWFYKANTERNKTRARIYEIVSNKHLAFVFDELKLELNPIFHVGNTLYKAKANQIEHFIYQLYEEKGLDKTKEFIIQNIIGIYYKANKNENNNK